MKKWNARLYEDPTRNWAISLWIYGTTMVEQKVEGRRGPIFLEREFLLTTAETEFERHSPAEPTLNFRGISDLRAFMQPIVDECARLGIVAGNAAAEGKAQGEHLADLRKLIFDRLLPGKGGGA